MPGSNLGLQAGAHYQLRFPTWVTQILNQAAGVHDAPQVENLSNGSGIRCGCGWQDSASPHNVEASNESYRIALAPHRAYAE